MVLIIFYLIFISTLQSSLFFGLFLFSVTRTNIVAASGKLRATAKMRKG